MLDHTTTLSPREGGAAQGFLLMFASALPVMGIVLLSPIALEMQKALASAPGGSEHLGAIALTAPALALAFLAPFGGYAVDRLGSRPMMIGALILFAILGVLPVWLDNPFAFVAARFALGGAGAVILAAKFTLLSGYFSGDTRNRWIAYIGAAIAVAASAFYLIGGFLGEFSWRGPFLAYGMALPIALWAAWVVFEPAKPTPAPKSIDDGKGPISSALKGLIVLFSITALGAVFYFIVPLQLGRFLADRGVASPSTIGVLIAVAGLGNPIGAFAFRFLSQLPTSVLLSGSSLVSAAGLGLAAMLHGPTGLVIGAFVNQLGSGLFVPAALAAMLRLAPPGRAGTSGGSWQTSFFVGQFFSPLVVLQVVNIGGMDWVLYLFALANLVFAAICWGWMTYAGRKRAANAFTPAADAA